MRSRIKNALERIDSHLPKWVRRLIRNPEWQKSSSISAVAWGLNTASVVRLAELLGHSWRVNAIVGLVFDLLLYVLNRSWVWKHRNSPCKVSFRRNLSVWLIFFLLNAGLAYLLLNRAHIGTLPTKCLLGCYGIAMNPVIFKVRDKFIFDQLTLRKIAIVSWRFMKRPSTAWAWTW